MSPESIKTENTDNVDHEQINNLIISDWGMEPKRYNYQVSVTDPENKSIGLGKYTVYLVSGITPDGHNFSTRKRYSDFEWLRSTLVIQFPGVFIPPIPKKKKVGRFEKDFIEFRRRYLEEFLRRIFNRVYLVSSSIVRTWLNRSDSGMETLKKEEANRPLFDIVTQYFSSFDSVLSADDSNNRPGKPSNRFSVPTVDISPISEFSNRLETHFIQLEQLSEHLNAITTSYNRAHSSLKEIPAFFHNISQSTNNGSRFDLSSIFQNFYTINSNSIQKHYDMLYSIIAREMNDTECMLEAVQTLEKMQCLLNANGSATQCSDEVYASDFKSSSLTNSNLNNSLTSVVSSAAKGLVSGFSLFSSKTREGSFTSDSNLSKLERYREDQSALRTLLSAGRVVLIIHEMPHFFSEKNNIFNNTIQEFIIRQSRSSNIESEFWGKVLDQLQSINQSNKFQGQNVYRDDFYMDDHRNDANSQYISGNDTNDWGYENYDY
ncbi:PX domain-containing protein [Cryptosporidium canis]|uniref:PX domain-containing protein n=1 Tax=Cryptosporidium canis TaxID=195482 RepID=A0ABQ8P7L0_9CRYT|nr:PX domain-containing protein [Cryptosporidium canis]KAJ1612484.1 PX domain-containing protein [Cryptosporidium canis]